MVGLAPKRARQSISAARRLPTPTSVRNYNNRLVCEKNAGELLPKELYNTNAFGTFRSRRVAHAAVV